MLCTCKRTEIRSMKEPWSKHRRIFYLIKLFPRGISFIKIFLVLEVFKEKADWIYRQQKKLKFLSPFQMEKIKTTVLSIKGQFSCITAPENIGYIFLCLCDTFFNVTSFLVYKHALQNTKIPGMKNLFSKESSGLLS